MCYRLSCRRRTRTNPRGQTASPPDHHGWVHIDIRRAERQLIMSLFYHASQGAMTGVITAHFCPALAVFTRA